jgi:5'-nucleotidase/UDP-sugar diphosphatase
MSHLIASLRAGVPHRGWPWLGGVLGALLPTVAVAAGSVGPACNTAAATQALSFVHVADLHGRFGGAFAHKWARLQQSAQDVRRSNPYTLFTNGGDDYEKGSVAEQFSKGVAVRNAVNAMQFDVRVIGNHDYAWGEQELLAFSRDPKALVLASNTVYKGSDPAGFGAVDYGEIQVGCVKVGFFGFVSKPWNEFDVQYTGDFLPNFSQRWDWVARAKEIIAAHRSSVDVLVMVSHLGIGTDASVVNGTPKATDSTTSNIDLVLGGHNHGGFQRQTVKKTLIVQPEFYGDGLTRVDLVWDIKNKKLVSRTPTPTNVYTTTLTATNSALQSTLQNLVTQYAPDADRQLATLESGRPFGELAALAAQAGIASFQGDAALVDPALTWVSAYPAGGLTEQMFNDLYRVERQKSGTPGFNGLYQATVSGADLLRMKQAQPGWVYVGPINPAASTAYKVLLHKAPALNPTSYFNWNPPLANVAFLSETWLALDQYGRARTAGCMYLDSDATLPACLPDTDTTVWNFNEASAPFKADRGVATLGYRDSAGTGWGPTRTRYLLTGSAGLPNLPNGASTVMAFPRTAPGEGYSITHGFAANGAFKAAGLVSNYTLVMDVLWPAASDGVWRSLLQTNAANSDDGDWFVKNAFGGGLGISQYFGALQPGVWYRIALVANAQSSGGTLQFYINGASVGTVNGAGQRFALGPQFSVLTDNNNETAAGYLNAMLLSNRSWTAAELATLGGPTAALALPSTGALQLQARAATAAAVNQVVVEVPAAARQERPDRRKGEVEYDNKARKLLRQ